MNHETHYACAEQLNKLGGEAPCCGCFSHPCKSIQETPESIPWECLYPLNTFHGRTKEELVEFIGKIESDGKRQALRECAEAIGTRIIINEGNGSILEPGLKEALEVLKSLVKTNPKKS